MYKTRAANGKNNLAGEKIKFLRKQWKDNVSQRMFADMLQRSGMDVCKNAVQKIESGERFITDIELQIIAEIFDVSIDELISPIDNSE